MGYRFSDAVFVFPLHAGASLHLRNAGTTSACSSVGSLRLVRVSVVRLAPALYPIFWYAVASSFNDSGLFVSSSKWEMA